MYRLSLLIPDGENPVAIYVLACLEQFKGLKIHVISKKKWTLSRFSKVITSYTILEEGQTILDEVRKLSSKHKIDLCMPVGAEDILFFSTRHEEVMSFVRLSIMHTTQTFRIVLDKGLLADFLVSNDLAHPYTITNRLQFERELDSIRFPVLIKPRRAEGGIGIEKILCSENLTKKIKATGDFFEDYLVQDYIEGEDIDCSVLCRDGRIIAYTIQKSLFLNPNDPYQPAEAIEFLHHPGVLRITTDLMSILKWNGIAHLDLRIRSTDGQVMIIEVNPRFWGSLEGSLYTGVNFVELLMRLSMGEAILMPEYHEKRYGSALSTIRRKLKNEPALDVFRETNINYLLRDPLPVLARLIGLK